MRLVYEARPYLHQQPTNPVSSVKFRSVRTFILCRSNSLDGHECAGHHARRTNETATSSVCVGIVRVSGLRQRTNEAVSSSLLAPTLQKLHAWTVGRSFGSRDSQIIARWGTQTRMLENAKETLFRKISSNQQHVLRPNMTDRILEIDTTTKP